MQIAPQKAETPPYTVLAAGYDTVMAHVEYDMWAAYIADLLALHHPEAQTVLELGCGTGSLALELNTWEAYDYLGTDLSPQMIAIAREKAAAVEAAVQFTVMDFTQLQVPTPVDVVLLLYDGLNYLLETTQILQVFQQVYEVLTPGGIFIFDQSTPANSINNADFFEDRGRTRGFSYVRKSVYDAATRIHTTTFDLTVQGKRYQECHVQRAYTLEEVQALIQQTAFKKLTAYDDFTTEPATENSERVHWVVQR